MVTRVAALMLAASLNLPQPVPPRTDGLAPGYHLTPHGCITNQSESFASALRQRPAPYADETNAARIARLRAKLREVAGTNQSTWGIDRAYRLPLSIALYRAHHVAEARSVWRDLLSRAAPGGAAHPGTRAALTGRFHDALVAYAMEPPAFNAITFGDSGAAYNLQRGLNAAAENDLPSADTFLNYALECSIFFQVPHLALGVIAAMHHDYTTARHEWLADLEGWDPAPPDTASITQPQFDAIRLLLRYG